MAKPIPGPGPAATARVPVIATSTSPGGGRLAGPARRDGPSTDSVAFVAGLLEGERARRGTRRDTHRLCVETQAVLVLRWFLDDTRMVALARDNAISTSTAYEYRDEGVAVRATVRPSLHGALLAAKIAGHSHVIVDGTLIHTDRDRTPGPTSAVDLWWSGKHHHHGGNTTPTPTPWPTPARSPTRLD